jgi:hypothetical protein
LFVSLSPPSFAPSELLPSSIAFSSDFRSGFSWIGKTGKRIFSNTIAEKE